VHGDKGDGTGPIDLLADGPCLPNLMCGYLHTFSFQHAIRSTLRLV
jgi:hypothetical protein